MVYSTLDSVAARIECPIVESRQCRESANGALKALLGLGFFARYRGRFIDSITASYQHFCQSEPSTATDCFASRSKTTPVAELNAAPPRCAFRVTGVIALVHVLAALPPSNITID